MDEKVFKELAHKLRNPLTSILGFSELLKIKGGLNPQQLQHVQIINQEAERLLDLINSLLNLKSSVGDMTPGDWIDHVEKCLKEAKA